MSGKSLYRRSAIVVFSMVVISIHPFDGMAQSPASTALTYQGQLKQNDRPVTDTCDFEFYLWNDSVASDPTNLIAGPVIFSGVDALAVNHGLFTTPLDFGINPFGYEDRWLGILVRCPSGSAEWTTLFPRQQITPAPYALALPGFKTEPNDIAANVVGGSQTNAITNSVAGATIIGGHNNSVGGHMGTVLGGDGNVADGDSSIAAGHRAKALHQGAFVWADSSDTDFESSKNNQFLIRAMGGVGLGTNETDHQLTIASLKSIDPDVTDNVLRLMGPDGSFNHGARLNFGDANWVYLDEDVDDGLNIHAARRISLTGGNVGIGTTTPGGLLEVFGAVGDGSVILPKDSISSVEIFNEPGVGSSALSGDDEVGRCTVLLDSTLQSIRSRQLSLPTDGFVLVIATARIDISHTNLVSSQVIFGVSNFTDSLPENQQMGLTMDGSAPTGIYHDTITVHGLFKANAGDSMYHLLAQQISGDFRVCDIQLTAMYIPTAYGIIEPSDPGELQTSQSETSPSTTPLGVTPLNGKQISPPTHEQYMLEIHREVKTLRDQLDRLQQRLDANIIGLKNEN